MCMCGAVGVGCVGAGADKIPDDERSLDGDAVSPHSPVGSELAPATSQMASPGGAAFPARWPGGTGRLVWLL